MPVKEVSMQEDLLQSGPPITEDWTPQFTIEAERAQEFVELFEALGNEVRVEALDPTRLRDRGCSTCMMAACERYVAIYTRRRGIEAQA